MTETKKELAKMNAWLYKDDYLFLNSLKYADLEISTLADAVNHVIKGYRKKSKKTIK